MTYRNSIATKAATAATLALALLLCSVPENQAQAQTEPSKAKTAAKRIDVNKATAEEMIEVLPGVGAVTARKIIEGRPYKSVDDLEKAGVSARTLEAIRPFVMVTPAASKAEPKSKATPRTKAATNDAAPAGKVNLNTASVEELETLPGVGPARAKEIIAGRPYKSVDELEKIKGLGSSRIEALRQHLTIAAPAATPAAATRKAATRPATTETAATGGKVNLNTASVAELETLPGVGPARAREIIEGRPYKSVDDLEKIKGLGKARLDALRDHVTIAAPATAPAPSTAKPATKPAMTKKEAPASTTAKGEASTAATTKSRLEQGEVININTASQADLERLFGIGPVKSQAIIDYRAETPFKTIEDIMKVKGIKEGEFAKIKEHISVR